MSSTVSDEILEAVTPKNYV